jgi:hypothetical protein
MVATKYCLFFLITALCLLQKIGAQQCGNCNFIPRLIQFDFDVQVPKPDAAKGTGNLWPEWKQLFRLAGFVGARMIERNAGCVKLTMPPSIDTAGAQQMSVGGESFTNLPSNPNISRDLSAYGDYFLSGKITSQDKECTLHVEIETACSRKTLATTEIKFPLDSVMQNAMSIAEQVTAQFSPLADKIKKFEMAEREKDKSLSLVQIGEDPIRIIAAKKTLKAGESTSFTIEVKDCDGTPLAGREIIFTQASFGGLSLHKTIGGVVTPAKLVTDAQGHATAKFTLNSGASRAVINAHSIGKNVRGCESVFSGSAFINIRQIYSGQVTYTYSNSVHCEGEATTTCMHNTATDKLASEVKYMAAFYQEGEKDEGLYINYDTETDEDPGGVPNTLGSGSYSLDQMKLSKDVVICESVAKGQETIQRIQTRSGGGLKNGHLSFSFSEGNKGSLRLVLVFATTTAVHFEQTGLPAQTNTTGEDLSWEVEFDALSDKNFSVKKEKLGAKTKYTIEGKRITNPGCNMNATETIKMVVYEE